MTADLITAATPAAIDVNGADSDALLQGQLSTDLRDLQAGQVTLSAWVNPAGRVIAIVDLVRIPGGVRLFVPRDLATDVAARLGRFVFRAKAEIRTRDETLAVLTATPPPGTVPRPTPLGVVECFASGDTAPAPAAATGHDWRAAHVAQGIAWIDAAASERYTAHQLNLDLLGAASLDKGCYSGQEIIARTAHRGRVKRRVRGLRTEGTADPAWAGTAVAADTGKVGEIVSAAGSGSGGNANVLALLPVDLPGDGLRGEACGPLAAAALPYRVPTEA